jgi:hypothetical protein
MRRLRPPAHPSCLVVGTFFWAIAAVEEGATRKVNLAEETISAYERARESHKFVLSEGGWWPSRSHEDPAFPLRGVR